MNKIFAKEQRGLFGRASGGNGEAEWAAPAMPTEDRGQEQLKGGALMLYIFASKFPHGNLKLGGCCGNGPSELRSVSLPKRPHVGGHSTFIDMMPTRGTMML